MDISCPIDWEKEIFGPPDLGHGALPDGFIFDQDGNAWVTIISRNGIVVVSEGGADEFVIRWRGRPHRLRGKLRFAAPAHH